MQAEMVTVLATTRRARRMSLRAIASANRLVVATLMKEARYMVWSQAAVEGARAARVVASL